MMFFVYILQSEKTLEFYKGQAEDVFERLRRHNNGREASTKHGIPWKLLWYTQKTTRGEAVVLEKKLKNLSRTRLLRFMEKFSLDRVACPDVSAGAESQDADP